LNVSITPPVPKLISHKKVLFCSSPVATKGISIVELNNVLVPSEEDVASCEVPLYHNLAVPLKYVILLQVVLILKLSVAVSVLVVLKVCEFSLSLKSYVTIDD